MDEIGDAAHPDECPFCSVPSDRVIAENAHAYAVRDRFPSSAGHSLVITKRHVRSWWLTSAVERAAIAELTDIVKRDIDAHFAPTGYNVGFNDGVAAGQTVFHLHVHVIPRYRGDVADPRGGIRHVLPETANYLAAGDRAGGNKAPDESSVEAGLGPVVDSAALIQQVLALLDEGRRSATYKPALLMALVELAVERVDGGAALDLPLEDVAERVMELYWPQTRPHPAAIGGVLRQATAKGSRIVAALERLRGAAGANANEPLGRVRITHPAAYAQARAAIGHALAMQPVPRLQRPGPGSSHADYPRFLYDDTGFVTERGWVRRDEYATIRLAAGVAEALARSAPLLRIAARDIWTGEVARINHLEVEEHQLKAFLFGAQRVGLSPVTEGLLDLGVRECFWCGGRLAREVEVDHVIPWSHYPNDDLFNLVLSDRACNQDKRDRLVTAELVDAWATRDQAGLRRLSDELRWPMDPVRSGHVARSAYHYLPSGVSVWAGRHASVLFDDVQRHRVDWSVSRLMA